LLPILETERLVFHPFNLDDAADYLALHSHPEVQRYGSADGAAITEPEAHAAIRRFMADQARFGYSKWKACLKNGAFVGRAGASPFPLTGEVELGYFLHPAFWGAGLASEAARGVAAWLFANTGLDHIIGFAHPENYASQRVLEKTGMRPLGMLDMGYSELSAVFRMDRP
jgi:ribosomal-protein-alanine N-acetyltransferase